MKEYLEIKQLDSGFSLLELLVVVALMGIFAGISTLGFQKVRESYSRMDVLSTFANDVSLARLQAVSEGGRGIMILNADQDEYSFGYDYLEYDVTAPITYDTAILTSHQFTTVLPDNFTMTITDATDPSVYTPIIFDSKGKVIDELGLLRSHTVTFYYNGTLYKQATITPGGALTFLN